MGDRGGAALLVDGDASSVRIGLRALAPRFNLVLTAATDEEARRALTEVSFDIAVVGSELAKGRGTDLISWIRAKHPQVATLLVGRLGPVELALEADRCDSTACLVKPFTEERLSGLIDGLLSR